MAQLTYQAKGNNEAYADKICVARMYLRHTGEPQLHILQGMPREDTVKKLLADCPDFCVVNGITKNTYPLLFSPEKFVTNKVAYSMSGAQIGA
jgi:hypothetical protein